MKKIISILFSLPLFLEALIIQTSQIDEVLSHIHSNSWVFFDIDDTLLTSQMQLGKSDYYFLELAQLKRQGIEDDLAHDICRANWMQRQERCPIRLIDPLISATIRQIQKNALYTMGLTARGAQTDLITHKQLQSLDLDFTSSSPINIPVDLPDRHLYKHGIWFVEFNEKGFAVRTWLNALSEHPTKIIFVDDRRHHLENMESQLSDLDIEYVGIHYLKTLDYPFDPTIAQIQAEQFPHLVPDEELLNAYN